MTGKREVVQGRQYQGEDEEIIYSIATTNWGSDPASVSVAVKDSTGGEVDVTASVTSGSTVTNGDLITLPAITSLTAEHLYRVEVKFTAESSVFECYFVIEAEK